MITKGEDNRMLLIEVPPGSARQDGAKATAGQPPHSVSNPGTGAANQNTINSVAMSCSTSHAYLGPHGHPG